MKKYKLTKKPFWPTNHQNIESWEIVLRNFCIIGLDSELSLSQITCGMMHRRSTGGDIYVNNVNFVKYLVRLCGALEEV